VHCRPGTVCNVTGAALPAHHASASCPACTANTVLLVQPGNLANVQTFKCCSEPTDCTCILSPFSLQLFHLLALLVYAAHLSMVPPPTCHGSVRRSHVLVSCALLDHACSGSYVLHEPSALNQHDRPQHQNATYMHANCTRSMSRGAHQLWRGVPAGPMKFCLHTIKATSPILLQIPPIYHPVTTLVPPIPHRRTIHVPPTNHPPHLCTTRFRPPILPPTGTF
jgi:hypothetical protein